MHYHYHILLSIFILIQLLFSPTCVYAQHPQCNITGKIMDEKQSPLSYTSVAVYDSTIPLAGVVTKEDGQFSLKIKQSDKAYRLVVEFIGYGKFEKKIIPNSPHLKVGTITLKEDILSLNEVVVSAQKVSQKSSVERTILNASSNIVSSKGSAIDILRSSSSVNISDEKISIRGNSNILVLMDGIPTTISDLSTIPAANIKNIEVITNPDASYDADGTGGIINIISKKSKAEGFSSMVTANYGFNHFVTGNLALSYNKPKTSWRFSYNTKYEDDVIHSTLNRSIKSTNYEVFQEMQATKYTFNNNIALGADFRINPRNRLSIEAKCILPRLNIKQDLHNTFTDKGYHREENRQNDITWNRENLEASITYTHLFKPEVSDITIKGSVSKIWGHRPSYYSVDGIPTNHSISGGSPFIPALQADYKYKFRRGTLSSGIKLTYRQNDIYHQFYTMSDNDWAYTESLSNDLLHTELIPAAYAMYASRIGKKFSYKIGIRGEFSTVTLNSKHEAIDKQVNSFFLAPSLSATQTIGQNQDLSLAFSRRIGRPTYPQLNPYMSMIDATTYEQGNMYLQPEKSTKVDLSYNYQGANLSLFANGYVNYTNDYISQITKLNDDMLITTYVNADSDLKTGIDILLRITPTKWMNFSIGANTYHVSTKGFYEGAEIDNNGWTNNSNLMLNFLLWKSSDIQMQYFITTPQYFPQLTTALTHQMNIGIKQKLMKGAMTLSLLVTDIMNTARWKVSSHNNLFDLTNISKGKSRMLWLGMSYNFNSFKQKGTQKSETDKNLIKLGM